MFETVADTTLMDVSINSKVPRRIRQSVQLGWDITREVGASLLTYELYPLGFVGKSLPTVPTLDRTPNTRRLPILFIHGIFHNRSAFAWLKQKLALGGWRHFKEIDLLTTIHPIPTLAEQTALHVRHILDRYQVSQVDIVAHSMGGIVARYYVQLLGGDGVVRNLVTLGTPHSGTEWSRFSLLPHLRELTPKSKTISTLNSCAPPSHTRAVSVSGSLDIIVPPKDAAWWEGVRNIQLSRVGHAGLLFSKRVAQVIASHLDPRV